jgi:hypothetical protein
MLILEIAVGVLIALFIFNYYNKKKELENKNKEKLKETLEFIEEYNQKLDQRIEEGFINHLAIFGGRLLTLKDDAKITFQDAALIELRIFMEHCGILSDKLSSSEEENLKSLSIDDIHKKQIEAQIQSSISIKNNTAQRSAIKMMEDKLIELANES